MKQYEWWITLDHTSHSGLCHTRGGTRWSGSSQQVAAFQHLRLRHVKARCSGSNQTMCFRFFLLFSHKLTTQKNRERERETNSHKFISWLHNLWWGEWYLVCLLCTFERCWLSFCYNILTLLFPLGSLLSNWKHVVPKAFLRSRWLRTLEEDRGWNKSCEMFWMFVNAAWFICYVVDLLPFGCWATKCVREDSFEVEKEDRRLEAIEINKSLSALGDVIEAGSDVRLWRAFCWLEKPLCQTAHRQLPKRRSTYRTGVPQQHNKHEQTKVIGMLQAFNFEESTPEPESTGEFSATISSTRASTLGTPGMLWSKQLRSYVCADRQSYKHEWLSYFLILLQRILPFARCHVGSCGSF